MADIRGLFWAGGDVRIVIDADGLRRADLASTDPVAATADEEDAVRSVRSVELASYSPSGVVREWRYSGVGQQSADCTITFGGRRLAPDGIVLIATLKTSLGGAETETKHKLVIMDSEARPRAPYGALARLAWRRLSRCCCENDAAGFASYSSEFPVRLVWSRH